MVQIGAARQIQEPGHVSQATRSLLSSNGGKGVRCRMGNMPIGAVPERVFTAGPARVLGLSDSMGACQYDCGRALRLRLPASYHPLSCSYGGFASPAITTSTPFFGSPGGCFGLGRAGRPRSGHSPKCYSANGVGDRRSVFNHLPRPGPGERHGGEAIAGQQIAMRRLSPMRGFGPVHGTPHSVSYHPACIH